MTDMDAAYRKDYEGKEAMRALRGSILHFLERPPSRCSSRTEDALDKAVTLLERDEAQIVQAWD